MCLEISIIVKVKKSDKIVNPTHVGVSARSVFDPKVFDLWSNARFDQPILFVFTRCLSLESKGTGWVFIPRFLRRPFLPRTEKGLWTERKKRTPNLQSLWLHSGPSFPSVPSARSIKRGSRKLRPYGREDPPQELSFYPGVYTLTVNLSYRRFKNGTRGKNLLPWMKRREKKVSSVPL